MIQRSIRWQCLGLACLGMQELGCAYSRAPEKEFNMPASILDATEQQLKRSQAKVTYLGLQTKPIASAAFTTTGYPLSLSRFTEFQHNCEVYDNDEAALKSSQVTSTEMSRMLSAVKPTVIRSDDAENPVFLSFCVVRETNAGSAGQEYWVESARAQEFYRQMINALEPNNTEAREILDLQRRIVCGQE